MAICSTPCWTAPARLLPRPYSDGLALTIRTIAETGSTNDDLLALAGEGAAEGTWLRAEHQTKGRGRLGREWVEIPGNLFCSTIVRLRAQDPAAHTLALVAGIAAHEAIEMHATTDRAALCIKWPNDVLWNGAKLCGVLLERSSDAVVVGFGINVTAHPEIADRTLASLRAMGSNSDAAAVLETLAARFAHWLAVWRVEGLRSITVAWNQRALPPGTEMRVSIPDGTEVAGQFVELADDGALILRLANGATRAIHAGDVFLI